MNFELKLKCTYFLVLSSIVAAVDGCDDIQQNGNEIELAMKSKGRPAHCKVIIDDGTVDVVAYEMSVEISNNSTPSHPSSSTTTHSSTGHVSPGLMFNIQEIDAETDDDVKFSSTTNPKNYDFVFLRFVNFEKYY